jgi:hypothetical protein
MRWCLPAPAHWFLTNPSNSKIGDTVSGFTLLAACQGHTAIPNDSVIYPNEAS